MWWGGFSEIQNSLHSKEGFAVLIPMWWGGFSEDVVQKKSSMNYTVLIPMWWGGFSESGGVFSLLNSAA